MYKIINTHVFNNKIGESIPSMHIMQASQQCNNVEPSHISHKVYNGHSLSQVQFTPSEFGVNKHADDGVAVLVTVYKSLT